MLEEADRLWEATLVLEYGIVINIRPKLNLRSKLLSLKLHNVKSVDLDGLGPRKQIEKTKRCIIEYGGKVRSTKNPYDITLFNIDQFLDAPHFTCVGVNGHAKAGIKLDKLLNFNEEAAKREAKTIW